MKHVLIGALAALGAGGAAFADEVWDSPVGEIVYEADVDGHAVLSYPANESGERGLAFVEGLPAALDDRGRFTGYWTEADLGRDSEDACPFSIFDATGRKTNHWGRLEVIFNKTEFPSNFVALRGSCLDDPTFVLSAEAKTG